MQHNTGIDHGREDFPESTKWELLKERLLTVMTTDLNREEKNKEEMIVKLEGKFGKTREELISIFETKQRKRK